MDSGRFLLPERRHFYAEYHNTPYRIYSRYGIRLCDPEQNREYLKDKPFTPCGELAAVYRIQVMESKEGVASAVVTDRMMELWGVTKEQLHQDAVAAETERSPVCFYSMKI